MEERLQSHREAINGLYLKVGGYQEIMSMHYWEFCSIMQSMVQINKVASGKPIVKKGPISRSAKDMIARRKNQR